MVEGWSRVGRGLVEGWSRVGRGLVEGWLVFAVCDGARLGAHGHHHVEEWGFDFHGCSAHFVDEIDVDHLVGECAERVHDEVWVE